MDAIQVNPKKENRRIKFKPQFEVKLFLEDQKVEAIKSAECKMEKYQQGIHIAE